MATSPKPDYETVSSLFKQIDEELSKDINNTMKLVGLTMSQSRVLLALDRAKNGTMTLKELEHALHISQSTCVGLVTRLAEKELIELRQDPDDRRVKTATLIRAGREHLYAARAIPRQAERHLLAPLSEAEKQELFRLLSKIRKGMK
ncbi:MAG: MarR family transcriptional regulator [Clostridia bacterium]|nr:MarR family transcriptional regulator [Clostridia bacterium]